MPGRTPCQPHREPMLNLFLLKKAFRSASVEASNNTFQRAIRKAFGFRNADVLKVAVLPQLGD